MRHTQASSTRNRVRQRQGESVLATFANSGRRIANVVENKWDFARIGRGMAAATSWLGAACHRTHCQAKNEESRLT